MANPLAKSIMNNISKKKIDNSDKSVDKDKQSCIKNINEKEEEILKSILYKNKTKVNLNTLKNENNKTIKPEKESISNKSKKTSLKELANKKEISDNSNNTNSKDKKNKKIISLKDLAK